MDRRERATTEEETIRMAFAALSSGLWTALPGIVQSFNAVACTCVVQPAIKGRIRTAAGDIHTVNLPQLLDCPVVFQGGGDFLQTFPVDKGDECLVVFADRCIDAWWQQGDIQPPMELRIHDLSDGFAIVGPFSQPRVPGGISTTTAQFRNKAGDTYVEIAGGGIVNIVAPTQINMNTPILRVAGVIEVINENSVTNACTMTGNINLTGSMVASGDVTAAGTSLHTHVHGDVTNGSGETTGPV